jgi:hypothetical protein
MAFCGQCGLLLNTNITKCPRCGTTTDFNDVTPGAPAADNAATIIAHTNNPPPGNAPSMPYTPPPSDATKGSYYTAPGGTIPQSNSNYVLPGAFQQGVPQSGGNYMIPNPQTYQGGNQVPGMYPPGVFPGTDPGDAFQPTPPRKTRKWPIILVIVLVVALVAVTVMFFALGSNPLASLFGPKSTPTVQATPIAPTAGATPQITATSTPTQQAQATVQQYYTDINAHNYQDAYYLWVNNPDNYNHYVQGFAHTQRDDITLGDAIPQTDGTVQVHLTIQATEDATGGGTQVSTYQGYYTVGQQADGSWKIINGQLS